jgi:hypothetical protein
MRFARFLPYVLTALGPVVLGYVIGKCAGDREAERAREQLREERRQQALADVDRRTVLDSLNVVTQRLVLVEDDAKKVREEARNTVAALKDAKALVAYVQRTLVTLRAQTEAASDAQTSGDTLIAASFRHTLPYLDARTSLALRRLSPLAAWRGHETLDIERLAIPLEHSLVVHDDGSVEAFASCDSIPECDLTNRTPPRLAAEELAEKLCDTGVIECDAPSSKFLLGAGLGAAATATAILLLHR